MGLKPMASPLYLHPPFFENKKRRINRIGGKTT